jgi:hypothetical protein
MSAICRIVALTAAVVLPDIAAGQAVRLEERPSVTIVQTASASMSGGWIEGTVTDERSRPITGAAVSAQGRELLLVETDTTGRFAFPAVPAGTYLLRVQGRGYAASKREFLQVMPARGTRHLIRLRRIGPQNTGGPESLPLITAGVSLSQATAGSETATTVIAPEDESPVPDDHDHSATAWRLRHLKRSVLRDVTTQYAGGDFGSGVDTGSIYDNVWDERRRFDRQSWAYELGRATASVLSGTALSGQVQLLTASSFDEPFELFSSTEMPVGIAHFSLGAPVSTKTTWTVEGAVTQGDVSSWFVAGNYATILAETHGVDVGSSYSRQRYEGANPIALEAFRDGNSRNVGGVSVSDRWTLSQRALLTYGGRYEHYDYLARPGLFSPSITLALSPMEKTWVRTTVAQRMSAPGAEEFVPQSLGGLTIPPQRTFAPLTSHGELGAERTRYVGLSLERQVASWIVGMRGFYQGVNDQLITIFDPRVVNQGQPVDLGHYGVTHGGNFEAQGWGVSLSRPVGSFLRGSLEYRSVDTTWLSRGNPRLLLSRAPSVLRAPSERLDDFVLHVESDIRYSSTRMQATYKFNNGYAGSNVEDPEPVNAARFDVQIYQGLPFMAFTHARWEFLIAVRNLFHDPQEDPTRSVYDELLVVRPPKRVIGGLTVQF